MSDRDITHTPVTDEELSAIEGGVGPLAIAAGIAAVAGLVTAVVTIVEGVETLIETGEKIGDFFAS